MPHTLYNDRYREAVKNSAKTKNYAVLGGKPAFKEAQMFANVKTMRHWAKTPVFPGLMTFFTKDL
jgi:hypothetical protein